MTRESSLKAPVLLLDTLGGTSGLDTTTGNHYEFAGTSLCNLTNSLNLTAQFHEKSAKSHSQILWSDS